MSKKKKPPAGNADQKNKVEMPSDPIQIMLTKPVMILNEDGVIHSINGPMIRTLDEIGRKSREKCFQTMFELIDADSFLHNLKSIAETSEQISVSTSIISSAGLQVPLNFDICVLSEDQNGGRFFLASLQPQITENTDSDPQPDHDAQLQLHYNRRLKLLSEVTASVTGEISLEELADRIVKEIVKAFEVDACVLRVIEGNDLVLLGCFGVPEQQLQKTIPIGFGLAANILTQKVPLTVYNVNENPVTRNIRNFHKNAYQFVSYAGAPLLIRNRAIGILGIYSEKLLRSFTAEDLQHLQIAANHVATAYENSRLFRLLAKRNTDLMQEIDERVKIQQALVKSEQKFFKAFYTSPDAININRLSDGVYLEINSGFTRLTGYSKSDVEGKSVIDINLWVSMSDRNYMREQLKLKGEVADFEADFRIKDGSVRTGLISVSMINIEKDECFLMITRDISQRKKNEQEITRINRELTALNRIILTSARFLSTEKLLDYVLKEVLLLVGIEGGTICLLNDDNTLKLMAQRAVSESILAEFNLGRIRAGEYFCRNAALEHSTVILVGCEEVKKYTANEALKGENINFHAAFPILSLDKCLGVLSVFSRTDKIPVEMDLRLVQTITSQIAIALERTTLFEEVKKQAFELEVKVKQRTSQLEAANKELEAFSYSVSHDLRAPLRAIDGFSLALLEDYGEQIDEQGKKFLNRIRSNSQKMAVLIDDILQMSRLTRKTVKTERLNLTVIVKDLMKDLTYNKEDTACEFEIEEGMCDDADPQLIRSCFQNLLDNAIKFSSTKPLIKIRVGTLRNDEKITYFVEDNGVGFDMKYYSKLFGVFQRLHTDEEFPGTGVGLATVQRIIHKHGGKIWAESRLAEGTVFYFTLKESE